MSGGRKGACQQSICIGKGLPARLGSHPRGMARAHAANADIAALVPSLIDNLECAHPGAHSREPCPPQLCWLTELDWVLHTPFHPTVLTIVFRSCVHILQAPSLYHPASYRLRPTSLRIKSNHRYPSTSKHHANVSRPVSLRCV